MIFLASDTSTKSLSVAVSDGKNVLSSVTRQTDMTHSQTHIPMICEMLAKAGLDFADIDVYACTNGPGSYTGIRIGVASTKAMAYASGKSAVGISTIETLAHPFKGAGRLVCPLIDARNRRAFSAVFLGDQRILEEGNYAYDDILEFIEGFAKTMASARDCESLETSVSSSSRDCESIETRISSSSIVGESMGVNPRISEGANAVEATNPGVFANAVSVTEVYADASYELIFCGDAADSYKNDEKTLDILNALKDKGILKKYDFCKTDPDAVDVAIIAKKRILKFLNNEIKNTISGDKSDDVNDLESPNTNGKNNRKSGIFRCESCKTESDAEGMDEYYKENEDLAKRKFDPMLLKAVYLSASNAERMNKNREKN